MHLIKNAHIYTCDTLSPTTQALLMDQGRIIACGNVDQFESLSSKNLKITDLHGKTILPGLCDSHLHLDYLGKFLQAVNCETASKEECLENVRRQVKNTPPGTWIYGHGWNHNQWEGGYGTLADLDQLSTQHPIYLTAKSLHAAWVNSKALETAAITQESSNPAGGEYGRDSNGKLNGLLFENALTEIEKFIPQPNDEQIAEQLFTAQNYLWQLGITAVHDFDRIPCFRGLQKLAQDDRLRLRVVKSIPVAALDNFLESGLLYGFGSDFIRLGPVKMFADGALGPQTAAMLNAYENQPENFGSLLLSTEEIFETGVKALRNNLALAVHAIGDLANRVVLDAFEKLRAYEQIHHQPHPNHRIEHVQVIHPDDIPRLKQLKVTASMQPIHLISDMDVADKYWGERSAFAYAFNSIHQSGAALIFGSDAPVESANPFIGMAAAFTRKKLDHTPVSGWHPEQCLPLKQILEAYTTAPAQNAGWYQVGKIKPGAYADLIVLNDDPFIVEPESIAQIKPEMTMVAGQWVYGQGSYDG